MDIMGLKEMYAGFFRDEDRYLPYADERAYREALFCYLRVKFRAGYAIKEGSETEESASRVIRGALYHIRARLQLTGEAAEAYRFERLLWNIRLSSSGEDSSEYDDWMRFLLLYTLAASEDTVLASMVDEAGGELINSYQDAYMLYSICDELPEAAYAAGLERRLPIFRYLIDTGETSGANFSMKLSPRVLGYLNGTPDMDIGDECIEIEGYASLVKHEKYAMPIRSEKLDELTALISGMKDDRTSRDAVRSAGGVIQIYGPEGIGKRYMLACATQDKLLFIDMKKLMAATTPEIKELLKRFRRECLLSEAIPVFYGYVPTHIPERGDVETPTATALMSFIYDELKREYPLSVWITEEKADYLLKQGLSVTFFELPMLSAAERQALWEHETDKTDLADDVDLTACANQYILTPASLRDVVREATLRAAGQPVGREHIREAVADQVVNQLGTMATHIKSVYTWDDLVIDEKERRHLQMICDHVRYRGVVGEEWGFYQKTAYGRGICAMFYGQPGTGKTMAAQVIANELGLELYRIDLSQMVSKYIGETQKNVTKLFERAKNTNAILFFDEADSLFSKRSEVKDFHDKNANAETAHLLQKLEDYEGITILATNYAQNIDDAFKRRIRFMVNFVFPDAPVRRRLWKTILPDGVPTEETLDLDFFADNFELSGSNIKEILTAAAFLAAADKRGLKNDDIIEAVRLNFEKHGKVLSDADFGYLKG